MQGSYPVLIGFNVIAETNVFSKVFFQKPSFQIKTGTPDQVILAFMGAKHPIATIILQALTKFIYFPIPKFTFLDLTNDWNLCLAPPELKLNQFWTMLGSAIAKAMVYGWGQKKTTKNLVNIENTLTQTKAEQYLNIYHLINLKIHYCPYNSSSLVSL